MALPGELELASHPAVLLHFSHHWLLSAAHSPSSLLPFFPSEPAKARVVFSVPFHGRKEGGQRRKELPFSPSLPLSHNNNCHSACTHQSQTDRPNVYYLSSIPPTYLSPLGRASAAPAPDCSEGAPKNIACSPHLLKRHWTNVSLILIVLILTCTKIKFLEYAICKVA